MMMAVLGADTYPDR